MNSDEAFHQWMVEKMERGAQSSWEQVSMFVRRLQIEEAEKDFKKYGGKEPGSAEEQPESA